MVLFIFKNGFTSQVRSTLKKSRFLLHILYIKNWLKEILIYNIRPGKMNKFDALTSYMAEMADIMQEMHAKMQRVMDLENVASQFTIFKLRQCKKVSLGKLFD